MGGSSAPPPGVLWALTLPGDRGVPEDRRPSLPLVALGLGPWILSSALPTRPRAGTDSSGESGAGASTPSFLAGTDGGTVLPSLD